MELTPDFVMQKANISRELATMLLNGVTQADLDTFLRKPPEDEKVTMLRRMNTVGGIRGSGFDLTGGRRGGKIYRIIGWIDPSSIRTLTVADFTGEQQEFLKQVTSLERVTTAQADVDRTFYRLWGALGQSGIDDRAHEKSLLQLLCYDVSKTPAYIAPGSGSRMGLILQKNQNVPSWKIIPMTLSYEETLSWARTLQRISFKPVKILYIPSEWKAPLKAMGYSFESNPEALYDLDQFANHPETYLNERALQNLKRSTRDTQLIELEWGSEGLGSTVIEEWRTVNEPKQRRLSIVRDYFSLLIGMKGKHVFVGLRDGLPVCLHVVDPVCGSLASDVVCQVTEKSLNYRSQPGGRFGTSDFNLWATSQRLYEMGYKTFNVGHIEGAEFGLAQRKRRLATEIINIESANLPLDSFFVKE